MAAAVDTEIDLDLEVDIDKPLVCEVQWYNEKTKTSHPCDRVPQWIAMCHDEVTSHDYLQTLLCGKCYLTAALKNKCPDDGNKLILKAKRL
jgi:hypothetical protein